MRPAAALTALLCALLAGCGSSGEQGASTSGDTGTTASVQGSLESLWRAPGEDVAIVPGTSDYGPGDNRVSFLVVDGQSRLVERPTARVWVARSLQAEPFLETTATLEQIGVPGGAEADAQAIYVTDVDLPGPGKYWLLAEPVGGEQRIQALGNLVVGKRAAAPTAGDDAVASKTPTLASTGGDLDALTTSRKPDRALYETSVAAALAAREPFVVSFATPLYCQSRTCGPVVDVVSSVRRKLAGTGVRFIHVEIYEGNDPANGVNRWVDEWKLPTEPFTFVVDEDGVVRAKLEGAFSAAELERAARAVAKA
jgi:hypothetical protein